MKHAAMTLAAAVGLMSGGAMAAEAKIGETTVTWGGFAKLDVIYSRFSEGEIAQSTSRDFYVPGTIPVSAGGGDALETFSILGVVAGATEKLRLVTSVLVLPYRNPVLTAKMVASLDVLSGGRVTLGVGVGWLKEEFEALDAPDFAARLRPAFHQFLEALQIPPQPLLHLLHRRPQQIGIVVTKQLDVIAGSTDKFNGAPTDQALTLAFAD